MNGTGDRKTVHMLAVLAVWLAPALAQADLVLSSQDVRLSTRSRTWYVTGSALTRAGESFVVVWSERRHVVPLYRLLAQRYSRTGRIIDGRVEVAASNTEIPEGAAIVSTDDDGGFVVIWLTHTSETHRLIGRRFDAASAPIGEVFEVSPHNDVEDVRAARAEDDSFVVVWRTRTANVYARRFSASAEPLIDAVLVLPRESRQFNRFAVSSAPDGEFVVAWSRGSASFPADVRHTTEGALFATDGTQVATLEMPPTLGAQGRDGLDVVHASDGGFVVIYDDGQYGPTLPHGPYDVYGRPFGPDGSTRGDAYRINDQEEGAASDGWSIAASRTRDDGFVVAWTTGIFDPVDPDPWSLIRGREVDATGEPRSREFLVTERHATSWMRMGDLAVIDDDVYFEWEVPFRSIWGRTARLVDAIVCGDANLDAVLNASDVLFAVQASVGVEYCDLAVCDVDDDGVVKLVDALRILLSTLGQGSDLHCPPAR